jgi:RNA polymerase sigma factor (TIGR02999 family)
VLVELAFLLGLRIMPSMSDLTQFLSAMEAGDPKAADELLPLVYDELRRLAAAKLAQEPPGQTLQATALVHEAWLKLAGSNSADSAVWRNRQHFFRTTAQAMRQILIDRARRRLRVRHGQNAERVDLDEVEIAAPVKEEVLLQLDEALTELKATSPEHAEIVTMRFFGGLHESEIAAILNLSEGTVQRHWTYARAWLFARIGNID